MPATESMLSMALYYFMQGHWVLPIHVDAKNPAVPSWEKYQRERPQREDLERWWTENPMYNIGFVTGRRQGICVLDIDHPAERYPYYSELFPTPMVAKSGKGGYHLYYAYPEEHIGHLPNSFPENKIDFRGDGGIIVAPPSMHSNGKRYEWINFGKPAPLPEPLLRMVTGKGSANGAISKSGDDDRWVGKLLSNGSSPGNRNTDAARLSGYFTGKGMGKDIILSILMGWYERTDKEDFPLSELERIIDSVGKTNARRQQEEREYSLAMSPPVDMTPSSSNPHIQSIDKFLASEDEDIKWLIEGWLPEATTGLIVAPPGHYKTWIMMAMAMSVGSGHKLFGQFEVTKQQRVLIIQQEDSKGLLRQRLRTIYAQICKDADVTFHFQTYKDEMGEDAILSVRVENIPDIMVDVYTSPRMINFSDMESMRLLELLVDVMQYKLVFIDPLYMSANVDNYMMGAAQEMGILKTMRDVYGVSFIVLHHTKKSSNGGNSVAGAAEIDRFDTWGSNLVNAWQEVGFQIRRGSEPHTIRMLRHYKNTDAQAVQTLRFDIGTDKEDRHFNVELLAEAKAEITSGDTGKQHNLLDIFRDQGRPLRVSELASIANVHYSTVNRHLKQLTRDGFVVKNENSTYSLIVMQ